MKIQRQAEKKKEAETVIAGLLLYQQKCALLAQEKGSSSWLGTIPIERLGFILHKGTFRDALCLRYCWYTQLAPAKSRCGEEFEVNHVLTCRQGGYHTIRHNELRDILASLLCEVCQEVSTEPRLHERRIAPSIGQKEPNTRLDIAARGFWDSLQDAFY